MLSRVSLMSNFNLLFLWFSHKDDALCYENQVKNTYDNIYLHSSGLLIAKANIQRE